MYSAQLTFKMTYQDSKMKPQARNNFNWSTHPSRPLNYSIFVKNLDKNETSGMSQDDGWELELQCQEKRWEKNWK